jgi:3-oxoacyl-[acyl-carrier protein] reductase
MTGAKVAVVAGAAQGMGAAVAKLLSSEGYAVVVADRDADGLAATSAALMEAGGEVSSVVVDVSRSDSVEALCDAVLKRHGRVDALVNTAGFIFKKEVIDMTDDDWAGMHSVNLNGSFYLGRAFGRTMREQRSGSMLFVASDRALYGQAGGAAYASSKAGVIALVKSLALELGQFGVTVNALNPGTTDTRLARAGGEEFLRKRMAEDPLGKLSTPEDIAALVSFMVGRGGQFMTGQLITTRMRVS